MEYISRSIKIPKKISFLLFGPRQVGKSTLLKHKFPEDETLKYDLLDFSLLRKLERDPSIFFDEIKSRNKKINYILIDEVQKLPWILDEVHRVIENLKDPPYFILTGSSSRKLKKSQGNLLAGRAIERTLYPFIYEEIADNENIIFNLNDVLSYGSLPSVYLNHDNEIKYEILKTYTNTYIKEEIKEEALVRNLNAFNEFLFLASEENGNLINYSNIAQDTGVSLNTIKEYYQILIDTLMGFMLMPIKRSIRQQIAKSPKFYFFDTGIQRALVNKLQMPLMKKTKEYGKSFEHWLIKEIIYKSKYKNNDYKFSFYRVNEETEVDLVIEKPSKSIIAIEIKASNNPHKEKLKGLESFAKVFPKAELICASLTDKPNKLENGILVLPWEEVLKMI
jgi:predicted AAA+ superfamily ATPase